MKIEKVEAAILFLLIPILYVSGDDYIISTRLGQIKGTVIQNDTYTIYQFKKIPYAKPPVGSLRFRKPEAFGSWSGVLNGTQFSSACKQSPRRDIQETNEDCLYLNIYVPDRVSLSNRSVMVWIHGGGLTSGSATGYDGSKFALTGDVIVVTINYRLDIFGFISSGDSDLPGNYGLWDQRLALEWVKNNIADFGGNPSSITIFGESAGGWSVGYHTLYPLNDGLFQRAIFQSGTANAGLSLIKAGNLNSVARHSGCSTSSAKPTTEIVDCLRSKSADELLLVSNAVVFENLRISSPFVVSVDGVFVPDEPKNLLHNVTSPSYKFFRSLDIIVGTTDAEGSVILYLAPLFQINTTLGINTTTLCDMFCPLVARELYSNIQTVSMAICDKYKIINGDTTNIAEQGRQFVNLYGDLFFISPSIETLNIHSHGNLQANSFQYLFTRDVYRLYTSPEWFRGAQHAAELIFVFESTQVKLTSEDIKLSETIMKYWTNFAKNGDPNVGLPVPNWPKYAKVAGKYLQLDIQIQENTHLFHDRVHFWLNDVPGIINPVIGTHSGSVRGIGVQYDRKTVSHFRGIPFAKPPIGNLRFARPQPVAAWESILDATRYPPSCMQNPAQATFAFLQNKDISEDCLYMNIYVPRRVSASYRKAVMIWIHGGGYISGHASVYDGSYLAEKGDVIMVAMNYRLGVFGFMSTDDGILKGNYGLWDQKMAIEWVKHNIAAFGGDPSSITIFGESAGGFSASLQAISPLNENLFQRVIAQSGTSLADMVFSKSPPNMLVLYANALNCSKISTSTMLDCIRRMPGKALENLFNFIFNEFYTLNKLPIIYEDIPWKPTVDGELIPDVPRKLLTDASSKSYKFFRSLDLISGTTSGEGSLMFEKLKVLNIEYTAGISTSDMCNVIAPGHAFNLNQNVSSKKICDKYKVENGNTTNRMEQGRQVVNLYGDKYFVSKAIEMLNLHSRFNFRGRTYQYLFSRQLPTQFEILSRVPAWFKGSTHGTDVMYLIGAHKLLPTLFNVQAPQEDIQLGEKMMEYWTNFAKTGNPNSANLTNWPQYTNKEKKYLEFGSDTNISEKKMLWSDRMKFWFDLFGIQYVLYEPPIGGSTVPYPATVLLFLCGLSTLLNSFE